MSDELLQKMMAAIAIPAEMLGDSKGSQYEASELARKAWQKKLFPPAPKYRSVVTWDENGAIIIKWVKDGQP